MTKFTKTIIAVGLMALMPGMTTAQTSKSKARHNSAHKELLANQKVNKVNIEQSTFIDLFEDIEPEPDIYTEGWNSRSVNPYREADVPATDRIDCRNHFMPVSGKVSSQYGYRPRFGRMHKGIDLSLKMNDTVYAAFDGKVRLTNYEGKGYGNYIILRHPNKLETVYGHLNKILVKRDQTVKAGDPIGLGGSTGRSTGPHLHFETRYMGYAINPAAIFDFANQTTHTDFYTFDKKTYTQARNFAPKKETANENIPDTYTVKKGDTLLGIARQFGLTTTAIRQVNDMGKDEGITIGQVLKLK